MNDGDDKIIIIQGPERQRRYREAGKFHIHFAPGETGIAATTWPQQLRCNEVLITCVWTTRSNASLIANWNYLYST